MEWKEYHGKRKGVSLLKKESRAQGYERIDRWKASYPILIWTSYNLSSFRNRRRHHHRLVQVEEAEEQRPLKELVLELHLEEEVVP